VTQHKNHFSLIISVTLLKMHIGHRMYVSFSSITLVRNIFRSHKHLESHSADACVVLQMKH
jgi:hypothetical protein